MKCDELKAIRGGDIHDLVKFGDGRNVRSKRTIGRENRGVEGTHKV